MRTSIILVAALISTLATGCGQKRIHETPEGLLGVWRTSAASHADRFMEFRRKDIVFGTGGSTSATYPLRGFLPTEVAGVLGYVVYYKIESGEEFSMAITYSEENGGTIRFPNQKNITWRRVWSTIPPGS